MCIEAKFKVKKGSDHMTTNNKKNNAKKNLFDGKAIAAAMNAYTKALEPISLEEFNEKIKSLDIQRISTAKEEAELEAPQSWEDRKGYAEYCEHKMDLLMKEFSIIDEIYKTLSAYYGGEI